MEYMVRWSIDIEAGSPEEAAQKAREIQLDPRSHATVFEVVSKMGTDVVDLPITEPPSIDVEWMVDKAGLNLVWMDGLATVVTMRDMETFAHTVVAQEHAYSVAQEDLISLFYREMRRMAPDMRLVDLKTALDMVPFFLTEILRMERAGAFSHVKTEDLQ
jgi:hypothetical protein